MPGMGPQAHLKTSRCYCDRWVKSSFATYAHRTTMKYKMVRSDTVTTKWYTTQSVAQFISL